MNSTQMTTTLLCLGALSAFATGCATTRAAAPVERPALEVPPPPPRVILPLAGPETPQPELVPELAAPPNATSSPRSRAQREKNNDANKQDPKVETPPPVTEPPPVQQPPPPPAQTPQLRIPETTSPQQLAGQIGDAIGRARGILAKTDYGPLSDIRKKAYDDARLFAQQAEDALKASNLVFAKEMADKAERLAREVQGR